MGVAATTHNRNRLSSVPHYKLSQLARLYKRPPPITRVSLSSLAKCDDDDGGGGGGLSSQRGRSQRPRDVVSMIRIERELRRKLRHVSRTGVSSSMKFKTSLEREAQTTPRNSCVPSPLESLSSNCIKLFARSENLLCVCVCVCSRARNYREKRFRFTSRVSDKMRKERMVIDKILWIEEWNLLLDSKKCNFFCCTEFLSYAMSLDINN